MIESSEQGKKSKEEKKNDKKDKKAVKRKADHLDEHLQDAQQWEPVLLISALQIHDIRSLQAIGMFPFNDPLWEGMYNYEVSGFSDVLIFLHKSSAQLHCNPNIV